MARHSQTNVSLVWQVQHFGRAAVRIIVWRWVGMLVPRRRSLHGHADEQKRRRRVHESLAEPGSEARVREWAKHIQAHRGEALRTLEDEGVTIESVFFDENAGSPCLIYYMRSASEALAVAVARKSVHAIDQYHDTFKRDAWVKVDRLELLVDLAPSAT